MHQAPPPTAYVEDFPKLTPLRKCLSTGAHRLTLLSLENVTLVRCLCAYLPQALVHRLQHLHAVVLGLHRRRRGARERAGLSGFPSKMLPHLQRTTLAGGREETGRVAGVNGPRHQGCWKERVWLGIAETFTAVIFAKRFNRHCFNHGDAHSRFDWFYLLRIAVLGNEPVNPQHGFNLAGQDGQAKPRGPARTDGADGFLDVFRCPTTRTFVDVTIFEASDLRERE